MTIIEINADGSINVTTDKKLHFNHGEDVTVSSASWSSDRRSTEGVTYNWAILQAQLDDLDMITAEVAKIEADPNSTQSYFNGKQVIPLTALKPHLDKVRLFKGVLDSQGIDLTAFTTIMDGLPETRAELAQLEADPKQASRVADYRRRLEIIESLWQQLETLNHGCEEDCEEPCNDHVLCDGKWVQFNLERTLDDGIVHRPLQPGSTEPVAQDSPRRICEEDVLKMNQHRKYYRDGPCFIKRSLREREYLTSMDRKGYTVAFVPRQAIERLRNEAAALRHVGEATDLPVPKVLAAFEDDGVYYVMTEFIAGVQMKTLSQKEKQVVMKELRGYMTKLHGLKSSVPGGVGGQMVVPLTVLRKTQKDKWVLQSSSTADYVFCHGDLAADHIIVDPVTLKICGITGWDFAGFWPEYFESPLYECCDSTEETAKRMLEFMSKNEVAGQGIFVKKAADTKEIMRRLAEMEIGVGETMSDLDDVDDEKTVISKKAKRKRAKRKKRAAVSDKMDASTGNYEIATQAEAALKGAATKT